MRQQTWFVTGAASGIGRAIAQSALDRGHRVVAAVRSPSTLKDFGDWGDRLLIVTLDLQDEGKIAGAVRAALEWAGGVDVLVNNAGTVTVGSVEESAAEDVDAQFRTNFFGPVAVIRAFLPGMRERQRGMIINISSISSFHPIPASGFYAASKAALEALSLSLRAEAESFGIRVMVVQPGPFRTGFVVKYNETDGPTAYPAVAAFQERARRISGTQTGDPMRAGETILRATELADPPCTLVLGSQGHELAEFHATNRLKQLAEWQKPARSSDFPPA